MTRRGARGSSGLLAAIAALLVLGTQTVAGSVLWTMNAAPSTATVAVGTTITLTATNLDPLLGVKCVIADIPAAIPPSEAWLAGSSTTANWAVFVSGQQVTAVIQGGDGNQKLVAGDWVSFSFSGVPVQSGTYPINGVAYSGHDCVTGARALAAPPAIVISGGAAPPTPAPTPTPPPAPTPTPEPIIVLPSILPTVAPEPPALTPKPKPRDTRATPTPDPGITATATARPGRRTPGPSPAAAPARPSGRVVASATPAPAISASAPPATPGADVSRVLAVPRGDPGEAELAIALAEFGVIDGMGVWAIPGAVVGGPGLIVILWVAIQAGVALAWVPAVRRLRGDGRFGGRARQT